MIIICSFTLMPGCTNIYLQTDKIHLTENGGCQTVSAVQMPYVKDDLKTNTGEDYSRNQRIFPDLQELRGPVLLKPTLTTNNAASRPVAE